MEIIWQQTMNPVERYTAECNDPLFAPPFVPARAVINKGLYGYVAQMEYASGE